MTKLTQNCSDCDIVSWLCVFQIPRCLTSLQQSIQAVLVGRVQMPDWLTHGIPREARFMSAHLLSDIRPSDCSAVPDNGDSESLASDGKYLYLHGANFGLLKIGSGYGNTVMVKVFYKKLL